MKILSWNVNGLRAVYKRGFLEWLAGSGADIVCLQEIKAQEDQLDIFLRNPKCYQLYLNSAERKGYGGVAVYVKEKPIAVERTLGFERFDQEGRFLKLTYPKFTLINLYIPHGGRGKENLDYKLTVYNLLIKHLETIKGQPVIMAGDFNIAHQEIDLARPKQNENNIMFTLKEREQLDMVIKLGFTDTFRNFHKEGGHHTWWSYSADARERNLGWRIDYIFTSQKITPKLKEAFILPEVTGSDHCPVGIEVSITK